MARYILLPDKIREDMFSLTKQESEVRGMTLYREERDENDNVICPLEQFVLLNTGNASTVSLEGPNSRLFGEFLSQTDYSFLDSHTHSEGSVRLYGNQVAEEFSPRDMVGISKSQRSNPNYMHLLITPKKMLLHGLDNPELISVTDDAIRGIVPDYEESLKFILEKFSELIGRGF